MIGVGDREQVDGNIDPGMRQAERLRGRGLAAIFLAVAGVLVASVTFNWYVGRIALDAALRQAAQRATLGQLDEFSSTLKDAETGQRGYLLTGRKEYLEPYQKALAEVQAQLEGLRRMAVSNDPNEVEALSRVAQLTDKKLAELDETIRLRRDKGLAAALSVVQSNAGKRTMDAIRDQIARLWRHEDSEYERAARRAVWAATVRTTAFVLTALVNVAFLAWVYRRIRSNLAVLEQSQDARIRLAAIIESSDDAIFSKDLHGTVITWNAGAERLFGYRADEIIGQPVLWLVPADRADEEREIMQRLRAGKRVEHLETVRLARDGRRIDVLLTSSPLKDAAGRIVGASKIVHDITERKRAEDALRESEQRFRSFVEASSQVVWTVNAAAEIDMANPTWQAYTGQSEAEARGKGWMNAIHPDDRSRVVEAWQKAIETRDLYEVEYRLRIADGTWRNILARGVPVKEPNGTVREYIGTCIDITARKAAEEALRKSEQRFRTLADAMPQLAWVAHGDGYIYWYNRRWYEYTGTTPQEMEGWGWQSVHDPEVLPAVLERWKASVATGEPFDMVFPLRGADGKFRPFLTRVEPLKDSEGRVVQWFGTNTDITEQTQAQEALKRFNEELEAKVSERTAQLEQSAAALRAERQRFHDVLDMLPVYVILLTPDYHVAFANRFFEERFGKAEGRRCYEYLFNRTEPCEVCDTYKALKTNAPVGWEWTGPDGRNYDIHDFPFTDVDGSPLILEVGVDITEIKKAEAALRDRTIQLQAAVDELQRSNDDLERFAYISSHDLQEPLRMMASYVQLLEMRYKNRLDPTADEYIRFVVEGAQRMSNLIKDLLAYSRVNTQSKPPAPVVAEKALVMALQDLHLTIRETGAEVTHDPLPTVCAEATQLAQVFQNLVGNAIKFHKDAEPPKIHIGAEARDGQCLFSVRDNGIGIEPQFYDQIFVPFRRLHANRSKYPGSGIGLAIVKRIVERYHGRVRVESAPGEGTTFYFTIPYCRPETA